MRHRGRQRHGGEDEAFEARSRECEKSEERSPSPRPSPPERGSAAHVFGGIGSVIAFEGITNAASDVRSFKHLGRVPSPGGEGQGEGGSILRLDRSDPGSSLVRRQSTSCNRSPSAPPQPPLHPRRRSPL